MIIFARGDVFEFLAKDIVVHFVALPHVLLEARISPLNGYLASRALKTWWMVRPLARAAHPSMFGNGASDSACLARFVTCWIAFTVRTVDATPGLWGSGNAFLAFLAFFAFFPRFDVDVGNGDSGFDGDSGDGVGGVINCRWWWC